MTPGPSLHRTRSRNNLNSPNRDRAPATIIVEKGLRPGGDAPGSASENHSYAMIMGSKSMETLPST